MTFDRYRQVVTNRSFRTFWCGSSFSVLGDGMTRVALICLAQCAAGLVILILLPSRTIGGALVAFVLYGMSSAPLTIWAQTLRPLVVPPEAGEG